jgi:hypothetical protein
MQYLLSVLIHSTCFSYIRAIFIQYNIFSGLSHSWTLSTCLRQISRLDFASWRRKWFWNHLENSQKTGHMWRERLQNIGTFFLRLHCYITVFELNLTFQILWKIKISTDRSLLSSRNNNHYWSIPLKLGK